MLLNGVIGSSLFSNNKGLLSIGRSSFSNVFGSIFYNNNQFCSRGVSFNKIYGFIAENTCVQQYVGQTFENSGFRDVNCSFQFESCRFINSVTVDKFCILVFQYKHTEEGVFFVWIKNCQFINCSSGRSAHGTGAILAFNCNLSIINTCFFEVSGYRTHVCHYFSSGRGSQVSILQSSLIKCPADVNIYSDHTIHIVCRDVAFQNSNLSQNGYAVLPFVHHYLVFVTFRDISTDTISFITMFSNQNIHCFGSSTPPTSYQRIHHISFVNQTAWFRYRYYLIRINCTNYKFQNMYFCENQPLALEIDPEAPRNISVLYDSFFDSNHSIRIKYLLINCTTQVNLTQYPISINGVPSCILTPKNNLSESILKSIAYGSFVLVGLITLISCFKISKDKKRIDSLHQQLDIDEKLLEIFPDSPKFVN